MLQVIQCSSKFSLHYYLQLLRSTHKQFIAHILCNQSALQKKETYMILMEKPNQLWQHFGFLKKGDKIDKSRAYCKECKNGYAYNGNTINLANHWKAAHSTNSTVKIKRI